METPERIWFLLSRNLSGDATEQDNDELNSLLQQHPELMQQYDLLHQLWSAHTPAQEEPVTGDKINGDFMVVKELQIGGVTMKDLAIVFANAHTFKQLGFDKKPALLLGMNAMRSFKKVSIDFASRKLRVVVPEHSSLEAVRLASARL